MKTLALFAGAMVSTTMAQDPAAIVLLYTHHAKNSGNELKTRFAEALEARVNYYRDNNLIIPQHITDTIISSLASGGSERASAFCPVSGGCQVTIDLEQIWSYGCWCMLSDPVAGAGNTMDAYDQACRAMALCNRCAEADDSATGCSAVDTGFQARVTWDAANFALNMDCSSANSASRCSEHLCSCQLTFLATIMDLLWDGVARTDDFQRASNFDTALCHGNLDGTTQAPTTNAAQTTTTTTPEPATTLPADTTTTVAPTEAPYVCCGIYPLRTVISSNQDCCSIAGSSVAFNPISHCCATDGSIGAVGTC